MSSMRENRLTEYQYWWLRGNGFPVKFHPEFEKRPSKGSRKLATRAQEGKQ